MADESEHPEISIIVANWNGEAFLREGLASLFVAGESAGRAFELIVVDDASDDGSVDLIRENFPRARLLVNPRNVGFAHTTNRGVREARGRVVVTVNNDVTVPEDFLRVLTAPFFEAEPEGEALSPLFAIGAKTVDCDVANPNHLCMDAAWRREAIGAVHDDPPERRETTFVQAGAAAYDRELFLSLGGLDPLFAPGYWEDYDLSFRAARAGWRVFYEPRAVARHVGRGSLPRRYGECRLERFAERNRLWFNWLNIQNPLLFSRHIAFLPILYVLDLIRLRGANRLMGCLLAFWEFPRFLRARRRRRRSEPPAARTDSDLMRCKH